MAEALYLVTKASADSPQQDIVNGIHAVLINSDDGGADADIIAEAVAQVVAGGHAVPDSYFDTVTAIADLTSGPLPTDEDVMIILPLTTQLVVT